MVVEAYRRVVSPSSSRTPRRTLPYACDASHADSKFVRFFCQLVTKVTSPCRLSVQTSLQWFASCVYALSNSDASAASHGLIIGTDDGINITTTQRGNAMRKVQFATVAVLAASTLSACATKGFVRKNIEANRVAMTGWTTEQIASERNERVSGDSAIRGEMAAQLASLRSDLQTLRTEFGTRISTMEGAVKFAMPVHFGFDDAAVRNEDQAALERFAQVAAQHYKGSVITIEGFADPAGSAAYNLQLSRERADAVRDYLVTKGLDGAMLRTVGYGKTRLVKAGASKDTPGAELNRRVTFVVETNTDATVTAITASAGNP